VDVRQGADLFDGRHVHGRAVRYGGDTTSARLVEISGKRGKRWVAGGAPRKCRGAAGDELAARSRRIWRGVSADHVNASADCTLGIEPACVRLLGRKLGDSMGDRDRLEGAL